MPFKLTKDLTFYHGVLLLLFAGAIPVGEGLSMLFLSLLLLVLGLRAWYVKDTSLTAYYHFIRQSPGLALVNGGLLLWLGAGLLALLVGPNLGARSSNVFRWLTPVLVLITLWWSSLCLPAIWFKRAFFAFMATLGLAMGFSLYLYFGEPATIAKLLHFFHKQPSMQSTAPGMGLRFAAAGFYLHRLKMAHVLLAGLACLLARQLYGGLKLAQRLGELLFFGLGLGVLLLTFSRAAVVALGLAVCLLVVCFAWRYLLGVGLGLALVCLGVSYLPGVATRLKVLSVADPSFARLFIWREAIQIISEHPLGVGLGAYQELATRYYQFSEPLFPMRTYAHSTYLSVLAESGFVGLISLLVVYVTLLTGWVQILRRRELVVRETRVLAAMGFLIAVSYGLIGLVHDVVFHNVVGLALAWFIGYLTLFTLPAKVVKDRG